VRKQSLGGVHAVNFEEKDVFINNRIQADGVQESALLSDLK
jgi:hypothetical protein